MTAAGASGMRVRTGQLGMVGATEQDGAQRRARGCRSLPLRRLALLIAAMPVAALLAQCSRAPSAVATATPHTSAERPASFAERFYTPPEAFNDRFHTAESFAPTQPLEPAPPKRIVTTTLREPRPPIQVASLAPQLPFHGERDGGDLTALVALKSSAFPYLGNNPRTDRPFLDVAEGGRRGHRALGGHVYWQDQTYNDNRVLMHIPRRFDIDRPGVIVVFFHGNGATLERDVRDRQALPRQISDSGANAVLLAPQLAVDARDSSAGKFWQPGGLKRFLAESAEQLALLSGDPRTAAKFAAMPVVIVGYSGGFLPAAYSLSVGGADSRIRGVVLLDAVYGELDKFAGFIDRRRDAFFVSAYTRSTKRHQDELMRMLRDRGVSYAEDFDAPLRPGSVVLVETPPGVSHRDYVTQAWTRNPVQTVLAQIAGSPSLTRLAARSGETTR